MADPNEQTDNIAEQSQQEVKDDLPAEETQPTDNTHPPQQNIEDAPQATTNSDANAQIETNNEAAADEAPPPEPEQPQKNIEDAVADSDANKQPEATEAKQDEPPHTEPANEAKESAVTESKQDDKEQVQEAHDEPQQSAQDTQAKEEEEATAAVEQPEEKAADNQEASKQEDDAEDVPAESANDEAANNEDDTEQQNAQQQEDEKQPQEAQEEEKEDTKPEQEEEEEDAAAVDQAEDKTGDDQEASKQEDDDAEDIQAEPANDEAANDEEDAEQEEQEDELQQEDEKQAQEAQEEEKEERDEDVVEQEVQETAAEDAADGTEEKQSTELTEDDIDVTQRETLSISPTSPKMTYRLNVMRARIGSGDDVFPLVVCLRCSNTFFMEKAGDANWFTATARKRNLKYAFTLIPDHIDPDLYELIHIQSASYLTVMEKSSYFALYPLPTKELQSVSRDALLFKLERVSSAKETKIRCKIKWKERYLTAKDIHLAAMYESTPKKSIPEERDEDDNEDDDDDDDDDEIDVDQVLSADGIDLDIADNDDEKKTEPEMKVSTPEPPASEVKNSFLDAHETVLVFDEAIQATGTGEGSTDEADSQIFTLERILDDNDDGEIDVVFLLDLVIVPRAGRTKMPSLRKYKHIPVELKQLVQQIYTRLDQEHSGYAQYNEVWSHFVEFSQGSLSRVVINVFEDAIGKADAAGTSFDDKLVHIRDFVATIDTVYEVYANEIKMEQIEIEKEREMHKADPIDIKMRRLDSDILQEHPFLNEWQNMSSTRRRLYDWRIWLENKWTSGGDDNKGLFLWRSHLVSIQGNYGESIFAFFQFTRWLFILNVIMALLYGILIFLHATSFEFSDYSIGGYANMLLGNEFTDSWWFYGAFKAKYDIAVIDIRFMWVWVSGLAVIISVVSVLRILLNVRGDGGDDDDEFVFSRNVLVRYDHGLTHPEAITLQLNSIMMTLHETLLERLDEELAKLTCVLFLKRVVGVLLCCVIGVLSAMSIVALIVFEKDEIVPAAADFHPVMESFAPFIVPAGITVIKVITPKLVKAIVLFERYSAEFQFQQTFFRVFLLRIFAILVSLFQTAKRAEELEGQIIEGTDEVQPCAETAIGAVLYKFLLFDMIIELGVYMIVPNVLRFLKRCCCGKKKRLSQEEELEELNKTTDYEIDRAETGKQFELAGDSEKKQFNIPDSLVDVMYRQGIVWSGMYFSPMIPVMAVFATILTFFVKKRFLFNFCGRPKTALGVTKQLKFFYGMLLLALIVSCIVFNYFLGRLPTCGPHRTDQSGDISNQSVLEDAEETLDEDMPSVFRTFFRYAFNGLLLFPLFCLALVYAGYLRGQKTAYQTNSRSLRERLLKEKNDKKQILKDYNIRL